MNKYTLACQVAKESGKPIKEVIAIISALFDTMAGSILDGEKISITSLGSFCLKVRKQHKGHDPHRNVPIIIPESMSLKFEVSPSLQHKIKERYAKVAEEKVPAMTEI